VILDSLKVPAAAFEEEDGDDLEDGGGMDWEELGDDEGIIDMAEMATAADDADPDWMPLSLKEKVVQRKLGE
jgi:hypothetical protein